MDELVTYRVCFQNSRYHVGDDGSVWGPHGHRLRGNPLVSGHLQVKISGKNYQIHRLVLEHFVGPCPEGMQACHFPDRDPTNNKVSNLVWGTQLTNCAHQVIHGTVLRGDRSLNAVVTERQVCFVVSRLKIGEGVRSIAESMKVNETVISHINTGETWAWMTGASKDFPVNQLSKPRKPNKSRGLPRQR